MEMIDKNPVFNIKSVFIILLFANTLNSCMSEDSHFVDVRYYPSGEVMSKTTYRIRDSIKNGPYAEYFKNGKLKTYTTYTEGLNNDTIFNYYESGSIHFKEFTINDTIFSYYYYPNGTLGAKNKFLNTSPPIQIGTSIIYYESTSSIDSLEYKSINKSGYLNQRFHIKEGVVVPDSSYYYSFNLKKINETDFFLFEASYEPKIKGSTVSLILSDFFDSEFTNIDIVPSDTILLENNALKYDKFTRAERYLKGYFYEYQVETIDTRMDSTTLKITEFRSFFDSKLSVSDTISL